MGIFRKLFGPSQNEAWGALAAEIGGELIPGTFWKTAKVVARRGASAVTLDNFTVSNGKTSHVYTRLVAPFENRTDVHFSVGRTHVFSGIARWLGFQDIQIGDEPFDAAFVIKGDDEAKVRAFFAHPRIRSLLIRQPHVAFEVQRGGGGLFGNGLPEGADQLRFVAPGVVKDLDQLKQLFQLFSLALDHIQEIGEREPAHHRGSGGVRGVVKSNG